MGLLGDKRKRWKKSSQQGRADRSASSKQAQQLSGEKFTTCPKFTPPLFSVFISITGILKKKRERNSFSPLISLAPFFLSQRPPPSPKPRIFFNFFFLKSAAKLINQLIAFISAVSHIGIIPGVYGIPRENCQEVSFFFFLRDAI